MKIDRRKTKTVAEFGDFQTPVSLAQDVTKLLHNLGIRPAAILEPTCGRGTFLSAALHTFPDASFIGVDINPQYIQEAAEQLCDSPRVELHQGDFFTFQWDSLFVRNGGPWLILGNPPWVTSSELSSLDSANRPSRTNFHRRDGMEAATGKSNFDISEWMLLRYLDWLHGSGSIAVLCKTSVARKILSPAWKRHSVESCKIFKIDAMSHFSAAVDACLFVLTLAPDAKCSSCDVYDSLESKKASGRITFHEGYLVSDGSSQTHLESFWGPDPHYIWRSGIKHDCSRVMELTPDGDGYINGMGERAHIEETLLYPMLKGSDIGNARTVHRKVMLVTQESLGEDTSHLAVHTPRTWSYLNAHESLLSRRGSIIYKNKPRFSIFGVGPYSFSPWKVAVSGLYKRLQFVVVGPTDDKPIVFDDTVSFIACYSEAEANFLAEILHSSIAEKFFNAMVNWSDKRPLTIDLLKRLSILKLATALGRSSEYVKFSHGAKAAEEQITMQFAS